MRSPVELNAHLQQIAKTREDYLCPVAALAPNADATLSFGHGPGLPLNDNAHAQMAIFTGIPKNYYDRMLQEAPELLAANVSRWLRDKDDKGNGTSRRLLRTIDEGAGQEIRAILSPRYRTIDNLDILAAAVPAFRKHGAVALTGFYSADRMHLIVVSPTLVAELGGLEALGKGHYFPKLHKLAAAVTIGNSEVGRGRAEVSASIVVHACTNLAIHGDCFAKVHLGAERKAEGLVDDILSDETKRHQAEELALIIRDMVTAAFDPERFQALVDKYRGVREVPVEKPTETLRLLAKREGIPEDTLLDAFMAEPEPSGFGVVQAITRAAQQVNGDDNQVALSKLAGKLVNLERPAFERALKDDTKKLAALEQMVDFGDTA